MNISSKTIHLATVFLLSLASLPATADTGVESHGNCCAPQNMPSQRSGNSGGGNSVNRTQQIQNAIGAFGAAMEQSARQQAAREQQEDARRQQEEWNRQQQERAREQDRARQQQIDEQTAAAAIERALQDPALNPFGKESPPGGGTSSASNSTPSANPSEDLTGQACRWLVVRDEESCGSRPCFYSEGQTVAFGARAYRCEGGRWATQRDCNQATNDFRKKECLRDIVSIFGIPEKKEIPAQKIHQSD